MRLTTIALKRSNEHILERPTSFDDADWPTQIMVGVVDSRMIREARYAVIDGQCERLDGCSHSLNAFGTSAHRLLCCLFLLLARLLQVFLK